MAKHSKQKPKRKVSNIMLVLICVMIILYTAASFALQYFVQSEISPTLTTAWYAFWGTEIIAITAIKCTKVKYNSDTDTSDLDSIEEE